MNPNFLGGIGSVIGRILISTIFLMSAVGNKIPNFSKTVMVMEGEGVPWPSLMLLGAILFLVGGSVSIIFGCQTRLGAILLAIFLILATYFFHDFWTFEGEAQKLQMIQFMKNMSLFGALIFIFVNGPGGMSFDERYGNRETSQMPLQSTEPIQCS